MRTHSLVMGYALWLCLGLLGVHRFYFGKRLSGAVYMLSGGLLGVGWLLDLFLLPRIRRSTARDYQAGVYGYSTAWLLLLTVGVLGAHRYYAGHWKSGLLYTCTLGLCGLGVLYDLATLNQLLSEANERWISGAHVGALATA